MNRAPRSTAPTVVALFAFWAGGCAGTSTEMSPAHAAAIRDSVTAVLTTYRRLSAAGKWDSLSALYGGDSLFRWIEDGEIRARSTEVIRRTLTALPSTSRFETTYQDPDIIPLAPGIASVVTKYHSQFFDSSGAGFAFGGMLSMTLAHKELGWLIVGGHASAPRDHVP